MADKGLWCLVLNQMEESEFDNSAQRLNPDSSALKSIANRWENKYRGSFNRAREKYYIQ